MTEVAIAFGIWGFVAITKNSSIASMQALQAKLESTGRFHATSVMDNTFSNKSGTTRSIIVQTHVDGPLDQSDQDLKLLYHLAFQTIREQQLDLSQYNNLRVGLRMSYNLGIRKRYRTLFQDENPSKSGDRKDSGSDTNF